MNGFRQVLKSVVFFVAVATGLLVKSGAALGAPDLTRMRALHMEGNWGGNVQGIRTSVSSFLNSAQSISAGSVRIDVSRSSFVNSSGVTITDDVAQVHLTAVTVGSSRSFTQAGFWVVRQVDTQDIYLAFRPSLDSSLADISGFAADITFHMSADGVFVDTSQISLASGAAFGYVAAVVARAPNLVQGGTFALHAPATFDQASVTEALQRLQARVQAVPNEYFQFLKSENAEWLGISVAIFNDRISDPTVKVEYRPQGDTSGTIYTYDDTDLQNFIARAKQLGFRIYLTLAFEPSTVSVSAADPTCNTAQYKVNRAFFGEPSVVSGDPLQTCINPAYWWWSPSHPDHAKNVAQFWATYTQVAVRYGTLAEQWGVDMYSLGTETENLFRSRPAQAPYTNDFKAQLTGMAAAVRAVYSGILTYDQHYSAIAHPEYYGGGAGSVDLFSDLGLDVVGVSAYFPLVDSPPTGVLPVSQLETSWESIFQRYLIPLQAANPGKPIVFTEFGYTDDVGAPADPPSNAGAEEPPPNPSGVTDGMEQQQNIFQAFFNVNDRHNDLVRGAFIWGNRVFSNDPWLCTHIDFNLYCKPSAQTVSAIYAGWLARQQVPSVFLAINQSQLHVGDMLTVGLDVENPSGPAADLYVGALLPNGQSAVCVSSSGTLVGPVSMATPALCPRLQAAPPGFSLTTPSFFQFTFPGTGVSPGTYQPFAALVRQGAFQDNRIDPGDILATDTKTLTFAP